jgi:prepilin peptidase CpaA
MSVIQDLLILLSVAWLLHIAVQDFLTMRISNARVLVLLGFAVALLATKGFDGVGAHLAAAGLLFVLGVLFWALGMMGAGDAKLYLPLGLLIGWHGLGAFALFLLLGSVLFLLAVKLSRYLPQGQGRAMAQMQMIAAGKGVPYAVPMALAATASLILQQV